LSRFVPTFSDRTEETGAMGRSCQFHRLLALQPQGMEYKEMKVQGNEKALEKKNIRK